MDPEEKKFGRGPRELTGAVDLVSLYKLMPHHDFFCKRSLPLSISDTYYLHNVVGDTEVRKGEGMQLDQLVGHSSLLKETNLRMQPFEIGILREAFQLQESAAVTLLASEKGAPTIAGKSKNEMEDKKKKHKKDKDKVKEEEHKKHKHRHKDRSKDKDKKKKRKHDGNEDASHKHKKRKLKSSKIYDIRAVKVT